MPAPKILIVDDNDAMRHAVSRLLTHAGYNVLQCDCGEKCLEVAQEQNPDLVLLDVQLPDLNGIEVLRRIKADPELKHIFVVHLSAEKTDAESQTTGLEMGADGYIAQPVENKELLARVRAYLRHKKTLDELRESEARYRLFFENNPQPMWIYDNATRTFLAANDSAVKHYGYERPHFLSIKVDDLVVDTSETFGSGLQTLSAFNLHQRHRKKNGEIIDVEISEHTVSFKEVKATAALIADVTQWKQVVRAREQLIQRYEREIAAFEEMSAGVGSTERNVRPEVSLQKSSPQLFGTLESRYQNLLQLALDQRIYKVDHNVSAGLRSMAGQLFVQRATPRDVVELHFIALKKLVPQPETPQSAGFLEIARLSIIELMGYLASAYRDRLLQEKTIAN